MKDMALFKSTCTHTHTHVCAVTFFQLSERETLIVAQHVLGTGEAFHAVLSDLARCFQENFDRTTVMT